jgi:peptidyl-prolyl cis-trans isomerase C
MTTPLQPDLVVNGERIPARLIAAEAQHHPAPAGKPGLAWRAAARALAVRALLLQEARRLGLAPEPRSLGAGRRETDDEALIRTVIEARLRPEPPTEAECRAFHAAHADRFRSPALYGASHILLAAAPGDAAARAAARAAAAALIGEIAADPSAFARLAQAHSACSSAANGGRLGQIGAGDTVPEFEAALASLPPGGLAPEPVETRYGLHVVRLDARAEGAALPYDAVRPRIREMLERAAWARAAKALVAELVASARISGVDFPRAA